jgi:hypothetical protein
MAHAARAWLALLAFPFAGACDANTRSPSAADAGSSIADATTALDASAIPPADAGRPDAPDAAPSGDATAYRDPLVQPFASTSIWNMPIGSTATFVAAQIVIPTQNTLQGDEDVIVLTPTAPETPIYRSTADWNPSISRCPYDGGALLYDVPLPANFVVGDTPISNTPNSGLAVLLADHRTIRQTQPFARCSASEPATSDDLFPDVDLYGDGIAGAHGGSGLSAIGGTLRVGELRPGAPPPRHALKLELFAAQNYYSDGVKADCYRWPASTCDGYFDDPSSSLEYGGTNPALRPGSLLAIPSSVSIASLGLTTEPARQLAWTLQNYGAYLVDDSAWSSVSICVENGPAGSFEAQFQGDYGFSLDTKGTAGPFATDIAKLLGTLNVVSNNAPASVGGGGTPRQPLAAPLPPAPGDAG